MKTSGTPTLLKCVRCGADVMKKQVLLGYAEGITDETCVCPKCLPRWKELQFRRQGQPPLVENEHFVALMQVASDDKTIRGKILSIARLDPFNRESMLNTYLPALMRQGTPKELISALGFLKDDDIAKKVVETLE